MQSIQNRYDFVFLFDVVNGNPNGDPDAGNLPRLDPETSKGLVTDVCLKRKIRNYVALTRSDPTHGIFVKEKAILNQVIEQAYDECQDLKDLYAQWREWEKSKGKKGKKEASEHTSRPKVHYEDIAKKWMCRQFYDVRAFGAVMSTGDKETGETEEDKSKLRKTAGQVRGPVQISFSRSIDSITPLDISITRMAVTNEKDLEKERTMGRKSIVPYGLYRCHGYISAPLAAQTGFSDDDLTLLWESLSNMFEHDRSAARGEMAARGLIVFKHESTLGNAPAHKLFELVTVERATDPSTPVRSFGDYNVKVDETGVPSGVILERKF